MNIIYKISLVILSVTFLFLIYLGCLYLVPVKVSEVISTEILTPVVEAGGTLQYEIDYCKYKSIEGVNYRSIVDGYVVNFAAQTSSSPKGCASKVVEMTVPAFLNTGHYRIYVDTVYQVNPLRKETVSYTTDTFLVLGKE
jgi:hypothetical protein